MRGMGIKYLVLNVTGLSVFSAAAVKGWALLPFVTDKTYLCDLIAAVFVVGLWAAWRSDWERVRWIGGVLVMMGLIGTVVGFVMALSGVDPARVSNVGAISPMVAGLLHGMSTALYTTLVGSVGYLWLSLNAFLLAKQEI